GRHLRQVRAIQPVRSLDPISVSTLADGEAIGAIVALAPPAIEDAQVEAPMAARLHAAGARSFQRTARSVEPHVAARDHLPRDMHVIVFDEYKMPLQVAVFAEMDDVLDVALAVLVARMGFAGEYKLNRTGLNAGQAE